MQHQSAGLAVERLQVWRGERHVLRGISFELKSGGLLHVHGPNGAGKSTLLRVVSGLLTPEEGRVSWQGQPISKDRDAYHRSLAFASHEPALKADLTALENLHYAVGMRREVSAQELHAALARTGVAHCADLPARVLSAGQKRRVAMARVVAMRASLWLLDEPLTNLDPAGSAIFSDLLSEHVANGGMALVVAHQEMQLSVTITRVGLDA
jgi:heme exporter protein A